MFLLERFKNSKIGHVGLKEYSTRLSAPGNSWEKCNDRMDSHKKSVTQAECDGEWSKMKDLQ